MYLWYTKLLLYSDQTGSHIGHSKILNSIASSMDGALSVKWASVEVDALKIIIGAIFIPPPLLTSTVVE